MTNNNSYIEIIKLLEKLWYARNPVHENNADSGRDMFWETALLVIEEFIAAVSIQCKCTPNQQHGTTTIACCNRCGLPTEAFWTNQETSSSIKIRNMNKISESIFDGTTTIIPMADVQHIEKHWYPSDERTRDNYRGVKVITKYTKYNIEADVWENNIYLDRKEADDFLKSWCYYRHELESISPTPSSIQEGEERMFSLKEALDIYKSGMQQAVFTPGEANDKWEAFQKDYFKNKFGINI